jgi:hypothetical protein
MCLLNKVLLRGTRLILFVVDVVVDVDVVDVVVVVDVFVVAFVIVVVVVVIFSEVDVFIYLLRNILRVVYNIYKKSIIN